MYTGNANRNIQDQKNQILSLLKDILKHIHSKCPDSATNVLNIADYKSLELDSNIITLLAIVKRVK